MNIFKSISSIILLISIPTYFAQAFADTNANGSSESQPSSSATAGASPSSSSGTSATQPAASTTSPSSSSGTSATQPAASTNTPPSNSSAVSTQSSNASTSDSSIIASIQSSMATNIAVSKLNVNVASQFGVVKLIGNVNNNSETGTLVQIAESTPNVKDVDTTKLTVNNKKPSKDVIITAKIKGTYIREKVFGDITTMQAIEVKTVNGVVTLTGSVDSQSQADKAIKLAKSISGVDKVQSKLIVTVEKNSP